MKYKGLFILVAFLTGCGYFENDGNLFQKTIVGNIKFSQQRNSEKVELVLAYSPTGSTIFVENCKAIYYDSASRKIYVENIINKYNLEYLMITVLDSNSGKVYEAIKKKVIKKSVFDSLSKNASLLLLKK